MTIYAKDTKNNTSGKLTIFRFEKLGDYYFVPTLL